MKHLFPFLLLLALAGCSKQDNTAPQITLLSPSDNEVFTSGQTVMVSASVQDDNDLHMIELSVTDQKTGNHVLHFEEHWDGKTYDLHQSFSAAAGGSYKIQVSATDHHDNLAKKEITVLAN